MGFEPTTASLEGWNSTTELRPPRFPFHRPIPLFALFVLRRGCDFTPPPDSYRPLNQRRRKKLRVVGRQGFEPWKT